jgi:hypothetical protein
LLDVGARADERVRVDRRDADVAPGATEAVPEMASAPAMPSCRYSFDAATRTVWSPTRLVLPLLICVEAPMYACVVALSTLTAPPIPTATVPDPPALMPIVA